MVQALVVPCLSFKEMLEAPLGEKSWPHPPFEQAKNDPILILHSSGSTGLPKPITMTNGTFAVLDSERKLPTTPGRSNRDFSIWDFPGGGKFFTVFPYFHLAGFLSLVVNPIFTKSSSPVIGPALAPPSGQLMKKVLRQQEIKALYIPPSVAEQLLAEPDGLDYFKGLDFICYTGGPFSPDAAEKLVKVTDLVPLYGSTEAFQTPQLVPAREDYAYMEWNPHFKHEMQEAEDGAYELVLYTDSTTEKRSALNHNLPGVTEWHTRDLFKPHPTKPNLWKYYGRRDDIIVFSNGEKFNPVGMELSVGSSSSLTGALVVGQGRSQAALLLEPKTSVNHSIDTLLDDIWPLVERANGLNPAYGQIARSKVLFVSPGAFVRAGKGTVIRKLSEKKLQAEIDAVYNDQETGRVLTSYDRVDVQSFVERVVADAFSGTIGEQADLLTCGLDSLKAAEIVQHLKAGMKPLVGSRDLTWVSLDLVYRQSSILQLTDTIVVFLASGISPALASRDDPMDVESIISHFTTAFSQQFQGDLQASNSRLTVALSGSTGALGSALLALLAQNAQITKIYCLNRRRDPTHEALYPDHVHFLQAQLHQPNLGLDESKYQSLRSEVDLLIHNAWKVNFALPLRFFEDQLLGTRHLIDLSRQSPQQPRIIFISSTSSVMKYPLLHPNTPAVPEQIIADPKAALGTGYSRSKFAAEQILAAASEQETPATIIRLGQIVQAGDFSSQSDVSERRSQQGSWIPALFRTARELGCFPEDICDLDWLELADAARLIADIATSAESIGFALEKGVLLVYNAVNPAACKWREVLPVLEKAGVCLGRGVPLREWVEELECAVRERERDDRPAEADSVYASLPAARILPFFRYLGGGAQEWRFETCRACEVSEALGSVRPVGPDVVEGWIEM